MHLGERINPLDIYQAYAWTCHICRTKIDDRLRNPDPMSATLDHVIDLCLGGEHTWDNLRPAHKHCNEERSRAILEV